MDNTPKNSSTKPHIDELEYFDDCDNFFADICLQGKKNDRIKKNKDQEKTDKE